MFRQILFILPLVLAGCAGTVGQPEVVRQILQSRFVDKSVETAVVSLGVPSSVFELESGVKALTWRRDSAKYANTNAFIKSDERCVITMLTDATGNTIASIGKIDDSLGAFQFSYCKEQLDL